MKYTTSLTFRTEQGYEEIYVDHSKCRMTKQRYEKMKNHHIKSRAVLINSTTFINNK